MLYGRMSPRQCMEGSYVSMLPRSSAEGGAAPGAGTICSTGRRLGWLTVSPSLLTSAQTYKTRA